MKTYITRLDLKGNKNLKQILTIMATIKTKRRTFEVVDVTIADQYNTSILRHYAETLEHNEFLKYLRSQGINYEII